MGTAEGKGICSIETDATGSNQKHKKRKKKLKRQPGESSSSIPARLSFQVLSRKKKKKKRRRMEEDLLRNT